MDKLADGDAIILVLSEAYLKSRYCTYELCKVYKRTDFEKCIFPIVVSDTCFTETEDRELYIKYWIQKEADMKEVWDNANPVNMSSESLTELKECAEVCREIDKLLAVLADMNSLTQNIHVNSDFKTLLNQIQPAQQQADPGKQKRHRQSDQHFRQEIVENICNILKRQANLCEALQKKIEEDTSELKSLADFLCDQEFETAIEDILYPVVKRCLSELDVDSSFYQKTWKAAKAILGWLSLLVVSDEWVEDQERLINADDLNFTVQVKTASGVVEVASARFRQFQPQLEAMSGKFEVYGQGAILPPQLNSGWGDDFPVERILIEIWNKVFPEDALQPNVDNLSDKKLKTLKRTLESREKHKTHHYYIPIPENQDIARKVLEKLPSIAIVYLTSSAIGSTLRIEDETSFTTVIREFLTMNDN